MIKKNTILTVLLLIIQLHSLLAQPMPLGPGNPGGTGGLGQELGAPIGDFVWGIILFSMLYLYYKWKRIQKESTC